MEDNHNHFQVSLELAMTALGNRSSCLNHASYQLSQFCSYVALHEAVRIC